MTPIFSSSYPASHLGGIERAPGYKLLFLADKYHLIRYGRTITNDEYWAMSYGPVGTAAKDVLSLDKDFLDKKEYEYAQKNLKKVGESFWWSFAVF